MNSHPFISIVIPSFNEARSVEPLYNELSATMAKLNVSYEIIFVDDGSKDETFRRVWELSKADERVNGLSLSRNFGHQIALLAGLEKATGQLVLTMDGDMQHPPSAIPDLLAKYREGFDIVNTRRVDSTDTGVSKRITSGAFYKLMNFLSDIQIEPGGADFRLMSRRSVTALLKLPERDRFTRGLVSWIGFPQATVAYQCRPRLDGTKSRYTFTKMLRFALDGITAFSAKPLRVSFFFGSLIVLLGVLYGIYAVWFYLNNKTVQGWTSILVTVLILGGIQLVSLGIIGEYIARIFNEAKSRPAYFLKATTDSIDRTDSEPHQNAVHPQDLVI